MPQPPDRSPAGGRAVLGPWQRFLVRLLIPGALALTATGLFLFFSDGAGSASSLSLIVHIAGGFLLFFLMLAFVLPHAWAQRKRRPSIRYTGYLLSVSCIVLVATGVWPLLEEVAARRVWARTLHVAAGAAMLFLYYVHRRAGINKLPKRRYVRALAGVVIVGGLFLAYDRLDPETKIKLFGAPRIGIEHTLAATPDNKYVAVEEVDDSAGCIECHKVIVEEWARSAHRHASMTNPFYRATVELMRKEVMAQDGEKGLDKTKFCAGCHDPALLFTGEMDREDLDFEGRAARTGLSCVACHTIDPHEGTRGNSDFTFTPRRIYAWERSDDPKLREAHRILVRLKPEAHKRSLRPHNIGTSEYCSTCHKAELDPSLNGWHFFRAQDEYDAWHGSGISLNNALSFYHPPAAKRCQDCHMPLVPDPNDPTADAKGMVRSHMFAAANTALPALRGDKDMIERTRAFLRTACRIDVTALDVTPADGGEPTNTVPAQAQTPAIRPGDLVEAHVVVRTVGVGHMFPGGTIDSNEVWVEFSAAVGDAEPFWVSGAIDPETNLVDQGAEFYRAWVADENGKRVITRLGTQVRTRVYVKTIPPGAADVVRYRFRVPEGADGPIVLRARLRYRKFMQEYVEFVFPKDKIHRFRHDDGRITETDVNTLPTIDMAETALSLPVDGQARGSRESWGEDTYLRVNDLGIGYLRQKDLSRAKAAFELVTSMEPEYADGWVNLARVDFMLRDHEAVIAAVQKALELVPGFPKALFFQAEVQRARARFAKAASSYRAVLETFPEDRRVLQRLALVLWEDERPQEALVVLEKLLAIDPANPQAWAQKVNVYKDLGDAEGLKKATEGLRYYRPDDEELTRRGRLWLTDPNLERQRRMIHHHVQPGAE